MISPDLSEEHLAFLADAAIAVNASKSTLVALLRSVRDKARGQRRYFTPGCDCSTCQAARRWVDGKDLTGGEKT